MKTPDKAMLEMINKTCDTCHSASNPKAKPCTDYIKSSCGRLICILGTTREKLEDLLEVDKK